MKSLWRAVLHRRCDRRLAQAREQHAAQIERMRKSFAEKQTATSQQADARIAKYAEQTRSRIAEARQAIDAEVQKRTSHAIRVAALAAATERRRERDEAFEAGREHGRREGHDEVADLLQRLEAASTPTNCTKIRLNDEEHAKAMVRDLLETTGVHTEPYPCGVCPRQLFGRGRFWHVRTINDPAQKLLRDQVRRGHGKKGRRLALRLTPEEIQTMKDRARQTEQDAATGPSDPAAGAT